MCSLQERLPLSSVLWGKLKIQKQGRPVGAPLSHTERTHLCSKAYGPPPTPVAQRKPTAPLYLELVRGLYPAGGAGGVGSGGWAELQDHGQSIEYCGYMHSVI